MSRKASLRQAAVLALAATAVGFASGGPSGAAAWESREVGAQVAVGFPPVGGAWGRPGPFPVTVGAAGPNTTIYRPATLGQGGVRHPVILWGNGTFARPSAYDGLLRHWASHGFIVAAANTGWAGSGQEMLAGATWLANADTQPSSPYYQRVDVDHMGAAGHSQGGGGTIAAGADPRVDTTVPIQPGPQGSIPALHGPMFILAGQSDSIVRPSVLVLPRYQHADQVPAVYGELGGANHFEPTGDGGGYRAMTTAWFRFWLMGDEAARSEFFGPDATCGICTDDAWSDVRRNARALAVPGTA